MLLRRCCRCGRDFIDNSESACRAHDELLHWILLLLAVVVVVNVEW